MNVFLLGNGFDLHHKFPTAYIDFLKTVNYLADLKDYSNIKTIYDVFSNNDLQASCKNIKSYVEQHKGILEKVSLPEYQIEEFRCKAKSNLWFQYLSKILNKDLGWIDFEKEIANVIDAFRCVFESIDDWGKCDKIERSLYIIYHFPYFFNNKKGEWNKLGYFYLDDIKPKYKTENPIGSGLFEIDCKQIIEDLYKSLEELQDMLNEYLRVFVEYVLDEMESNGYVADNRSYPDIVTYVFNFNYTYTVEKISSIQFINEVVHIHSDVENGIILGVNPDKYDDLETVDTTFIKFKKYYQRIIGYSDSDFRRAVNWIKNSIEPHNVHLYVVGHSLDVTDKDIIMELFELATEITIFYHNKTNMGIYTENLIKMYGKEAYDVIRDKKKIKYLLHTDINWSVKNDQL